MRHKIKVELIFFLYMILLSAQAPPPDFSSFAIKKNPLATKKKGTASRNRHVNIYQP